LSREPQSAGGTLRRIVAAVILIPLAVVIIAFATANRQTVTVSLDPFNPEHPAASVTLPLFVLIIGLLIVGVVIGGVASWLRHGPVRRTARRLDREARDLRGEVTTLKRNAGGPAAMPESGKTPERLRLQAPVR
jgi:uncharacterized integral membrane protein